MSKRARAVGAAAALLAAGLALAAWALRPDAGAEAARAAGERLAAAVAEYDREALADDPLLRGRPDAVDELLRYRDALYKEGYRVTGVRNGAGGRRMEPAGVVTHLAVVDTPSDEVWLGFRYDPAAGRLEYVSAVSRPAPAGPGRAG
jgi:hypothetical protein